MTITDSKLLLKDVSAGDARAEQEFFARFAVRAQALAAKRLRRNSVAAADAEDVAQSALHCFFSGAREHRWQHQQSGDLWRLLAAIVINKCRARSRHMTAAKRDVRRESSPNSSNARESSLKATGDGPSAIVRTWEAASWVFARLSEAERELVRLKLNDVDCEQIAVELGTSGRTIRRKLAELEAKLHGLLVDSQAGAHPKADFAALDDPGVRAQLQKIRTVIPNIAYQDLLLEQLVGAGGIGKVFRAVHVSTREKVAVKALAKRHHRNADAVSSLLNEAAVLTELRHPRIVPLRGLGQFPNGGLFLVMDLVRGENLAKRLGNMSTHAALQVAADVAEALVSAHDLGVLHCDLKPANILLNKDGRACVTDFGFARLNAAQRGLPIERSVRGGTPAFSAPELWDSGGVELSPAVDVYAWGLVLLAMISGQVPNGPATPLHAAAALPDNLRSICTACLRENPRDRYQSAAECLDAARSAIQTLSDAGTR